MSPLGLEHEVVHRLLGRLLRQHVGGYPVGSLGKDRNVEVEAGTPGRSLGLIQPSDVSESDPCGRRSRLRSAPSALTGSGSRSRLATTK